MADCAARCQDSVPGRSFTKQPEHTHRWRSSGARNASSCLSGLKHLVQRWPWSSRVTLNGAWISPKVMVVCRQPGAAS